MIYYTSDLHFGHKNIFKYEPNRPGNNIQEMQDIMVERWNTKVKPKDTVYILGDFAFLNRDMTCRDIEDLVNKLNGEKILITGNHDEFINKKAFNTKCFKEIISYKEIHDGKDFIIMSHYPFSVWNCSHYGSIHLHGHTHKEMAEDWSVMNRYNVGCMFFDFVPVTLEEIKKYWIPIKRSDL